jgi:hypothetical protein
MRKTRVLVVALVAALSITAAVAYAQSIQNVYDVTGSVSSTKKGPVAIKFGFSTKEASGNLPSPIQFYKILFEQGKVNHSALKDGCTAASMNAAKSDSGCKSGAKVGTGVVDALVGTSGQPLDGTAKCQLKLNVWNSRGGKAALFLKGGPPTCIAAISQAIDAKWVKEGNAAGLSFEVPESLRHQIGLDVAVMNVTSSLPKKLIKKGKGKKAKKIGFLESAGCAGKKPNVKVTFTDETGNAVTATKPIPGC